MVFEVDIDKFGFLGHKLGSFEFIWGMKCHKSARGEILVNYGVGTGNLGDSVCHHRETLRARPRPVQF